MIMTVEIRYTVKCNDEFLRALGHRLRKNRKATRSEVKTHYKVMGYLEDQEILKAYEKRP